MDKALRVRLEDAEQILSDVSIKCCEVLNLISVHGVTDAHREALHIAARVVYLIKYGSSPATMVVGKDAITKRAMRNPNYEGQQAGVVVLNEDGSLESRVGTIHLENESLVGGWARVYVKGYRHPVEITVQFDEYVQMKDGKPTSNWKAKPGTMIRKVALTQALREAFPEDLGSMYAPEEMGVPDSILDVTPVSDEQPVHVDESTGEVIEHQPGGQESDPEAAFFGIEG